MVTPSESPQPNGAGSARVVPRALSYSDWNARLSTHFFNHARRHRRVRLHIQDEELESLGGSRSDLARAAVDEAMRQGCETVQDLALRLHERWEREMGEAAEGPPAPPFLAVLVLYVIAVDHGDAQLSAHAYYERLHELLGRPAHLIGSIKPSLGLWHALERWSSQRLGGRHGFFEAKARGHQAYVGIPRCQALIAGREEGALLLAFRSAGLRPGSDPSDGRLVRATRDAEGLLTRTKELLRKWPDDRVASELVGEIRQRFDDWDALEADDSESESLSRLNMTLVLRSKHGALTSGCFESDVVRGITDRERDLSLDPTSSRPVVTRLWLQSGDDSGRPIVVDDEGNPQWCATSEWFEELVVRIDDSRFSLARRARPFLLLRFSSEGLLEECEEDDLRVGQECLVIAPAVATPKLPSRFQNLRRDWTSSPELPGVVHRPIRLTDTQVGADSRRIVARFVGGIRSEPGAPSWLAFATPRIVISGLKESDDCEVRLRRFDGNGRALVDTNCAVRRHRAADREQLGLGSDSGEASARFPALSEATVACELDVLVGGSSVAQLKCFVEWSPESKELPSPMPRDGLGEPARENGDFVIRGLRVAHPRVLSSFSITRRAGRPMPSAEPGEDVPGSLVMRLLRARGSVSWQRAKEWLPSCLEGDPRSGGESIYLVDQVAALHALGLVELEEDRQGGLDRLVALPPAFTLLPRLANRGLSSVGAVRFCHEALLIGCWLPEELERLRRLAGRSGAKLFELAREEGVPLVPHRRSLLVEGDLVVGRLQRIADETGVEFVGPEPVACTLARTLFGVDMLRDDDRWVPGLPAAVYTKRYFDPRALGVVQDEGAIPDRYVLWECRDRHRWHHFVVDRVANKHLRVHDRQLGRWFVRRQALPSVPVPVSGDDLFVPLELRLPRLLERVLALSAGVAPRLKRWKRIASPFTFAVTSRDFAIPAPPERTVDWSARLTHCSGNFCCYAGVFGTELWKRGEPIPMLGCVASSVMGLGLER